MTVPDLKSHEKSIKIGLRTYKHFLIPQKWYFVFKTSDKLGPRELSINRKILTWTDRTSTNINTIFRYKCPLQYCYKRTRASSRQQLRCYHNFQSRVRMQRNTRKLGNEHHATIITTSELHLLWTALSVAEWTPRRSRRTPSGLRRSSAKIYSGWTRNYSGGLRRTPSGLQRTPSGLWSPPRFVFL